MLVALIAGVLVLLEGGSNWVALISLPLAALSAFRQAKKAAPRDRFLHYASGHVSGDTVN